jgi:hypothetical protein
MWISGWPVRLRWVSRRNGYVTGATVHVDGGSDFS